MRFRYTFKTLLNATVIHDNVCHLFKLIFVSIRYSSGGNVPFNSNGPGSPDLMSGSDDDDTLPDEFIQTSKGSSESSFEDNHGHSPKQSTLGSQIC